MGRLQWRKKNQNHSSHTQRFRANNVTFFSFLQTFTFMFFYSFFRSTARLIIIMSLRNFDFAILNVCACVCRRWLPSVVYTIEFIYANENGLFHFCFRKTITQIFKYEWDRKYEINVIRYIFQLWLIWQRERERDFSFVWHLQSILICIFNAISW